MPKTLLKSRLLPNKNKIEIKPDVKFNKSDLPRNLQSFKAKLLSGSGFLLYKLA